MLSANKVNATFIMDYNGIEHNWKIEELFDSDTNKIKKKVPTPGIEKRVTQLIEIGGYGTDTTDRDRRL